MVFTVCPFCGIASEVAHDSQAACIEALHQEIEKARELLAATDSPHSHNPEPAPDGEDAQTN